MLSESELNHPIRWNGGSKRYDERDVAAALELKSITNKNLISHNIHTATLKAASDREMRREDMIEKLDMDNRKLASDLARLNDLETDFERATIEDVGIGIFDRSRSGGVELYDRARYFTMTGAHLDETPTVIHERSDALAAVHAEHVADESADAAPGDHSPAGNTAATASGVDLDDEALIERAMEAANGAKFQRLWRGDMSGYPSHSEADMALCCLLAFWTGGDPQRVDRLFRQSGLMRDKWDTVHYADGRTYGEATVQRALRVTDERYDPTEADAPDESPAAPDPAALQFCTRCCPDVAATSWTRDLEEHLVATPAE